MACLTQSRRNKALGVPDEEFTPIDFEAHKALSTVIRLDWFVTSFGYDIGLSKFLAEADIYLKWLENTLDDRFHETGLDEASIDGT
jgi:hypothetical protein